MPFSCCHPASAVRTGRRLIFRLSPGDFVQQAVLVLSRGKVIMKLSRCQQPYWIDRQKTEGTLCLRLAKPRGLRSDDSVCRRQKYPWHRVYLCVCALEYGVSADILRAGHACLICRDVEVQIIARVLLRLAAVQKRNLGEKK